MANNLYDAYGHCLGHVNTFYCRLGETRTTFELDNGNTVQLSPGCFFRDRQGDWYVRSMPVMKTYTDTTIENYARECHKIADIVDAAFKREALNHRFGIKKGENNMVAKLGMALYTSVDGNTANFLWGRTAIKKVLFNPPATIVFWTDGSKTVVKCGSKENFDPEKGLAMAIAKRAGNNSQTFYKEIQNWVKKSGHVQPAVHTTAEKPQTDAPKKTSSPECSSEKFKKAVANAKEHYDKYVQAATDGNAITALKEYTALGAALTMIEYLANE